MIEKFNSFSEEDTYNIGKNFASKVKANSVIALNGDLGVGKTVFVRGFVSGILKTSEQVKSPTFNIVTEYTGNAGPSIFHFDLYRLETLKELINIGFEEYLINSICLIEWFNNIEQIDELVKAYGSDLITVEITRLSDAERLLAISQ